MRRWWRWWWRRFAGRSRETWITLRSPEPEPNGNGQLATIVLPEGVQHSVVPNVFGRPGSVFTIEGTMTPEAMATLRSTVLAQFVTGGFGVPSAAMAEQAAHAEVTTMTTTRWEMNVGQLRRAIYGDAYVAPTATQPCDHVPERRGLFNDRTCRCGSVTVSQPQMVSFASREGFTAFVHRRIQQARRRERLDGLGMRVGLAPSRMIVRDPRYEDEPSAPVEVREVDVTVYGATGVVPTDRGRADYRADYGATAGVMDTWVAPWPRAQRSPAKPAAPPVPTVVAVPGVRRITLDED